jgi:hypothetical protein
MLSAASKPAFLTILFLSLFHPVISQDLEVGVAVGGSYYLGDLNPGKHFVNTQLSYGMVARYNLDSRWSVKLSGMYGTLKGEASSSTFLPDRGLYFTSNVTDISGVIEFNFFPYFTGSFKSRMTPYVFGGLSVFFYDPQANGVSLRSLGTEGQTIGYLGRSPYGSTSVSIPFGVGCKFSLTSKLGVQVYWEMHKTFTDYIDDVSSTYYLVGRDIQGGDMAGIMSDPTLDHTPGMQRGNSENNDWFAFFGASITYKFNLVSTKKCRDLNH